VSLGPEDGRLAGRLIPILGERERRRPPAGSQRDASEPSTRMPGRIGVRSVRRSTRTTKGPPMRSLALTLPILLLAPPVRATCGGGGGGGLGGIPPHGGDAFGNPRADLEVYQVPWKTVGAGDPAPAGLLVLYWFPASKQEEKGSPLQGSRQLTLAASRC